jgi:hypothetical protein
VTRRSLTATALMIALALVPALPVPVASTARGAQEHAPAIQFALLPDTVRPRRRWQFARVRTIRSLLLRRRRGIGAARRPVAAELRLRPPVRESWARGPPGRPLSRRGAAS